jgi:hypothetical protein
LPAFPELVGVAPLAYDDFYFFRNLEKAGLFREASLAKPLYQRASFSLKGAAPVAESLHVIKLCFRCRLKLVFRRRDFGEFCSQIASWRTYFISPLGRLTEV